MSQPHDEWFYKLATLRIDMLSETECAAFEEHIQSCALCQECYAQYRVVDESLRRYFSLPVLPAEPPPLPASLQIRALGDVPERVRHVNASAYVKQFITAFALPSVIIALSVGLIIFALGIYVVPHSSLNFALIAPLANIAIAAVILGLAMRRGLVLREEWSNSTSGRHYFSPSSPTSVRFPAQGEETDVVSDADPVLHDPLPALKHATPEKSWRDRGRLLIISLTLLAVGIASLSISLLNPAGKNLAPVPIASQTAGADASPTGISSTGDKVFDINRKDVDLKMAAAADVAHGKIALARQQWQQALLVDSDDAEVLIYLENQQVSDEVAAAPGHFTYRTLAVFTTLTQDHLGGGRDILQGAYVAQKAYNDQVSRSGGGTLLRLLIAVTNKDDASIRSVTLQVIRAARSDPSIIGVMGLPTSNIAMVAQPLLTAAHLPMVSPTASSVDLSGSSPYFFRIAPPDTVQGQVGAKYAKEQLHAKTVVVFVNDSDSYSRSLAQAFEENFSDQQHTVIQFYFQQDQPETIEAGFKHIEQMSQKPDLIYFAGFVNDASVLLQLLPPCADPNSCLKVMGGDALYVQRDYSLDAYKSYARLIFTAFAFPDAWEKQGLTNEPLFFREYTHDFDPSGQYQPGKYGFNRADADAILSYDAMQAFLHAITQLLAQHKQVTSVLLCQALQQNNASHAFQGVSRKIAFDSNGNPADDQIVILAGAANAQTKLVRIYPGTVK